MCCWSDVVLAPFLPSPTVVMYYRDSLIVPLGERASEHTSAWATLARECLCRISLSVASAGMELVSPGFSLLTT